MKIEISPATIDDALAFAEVMRDADRRLCAALLKMTPVETIMRLFRSSVAQRLATVDGDPAVLWGVNPESMIGIRAMPWMIVSAAGARAPIAMIKIARQEIAEFARIWPDLLDVVLDGDLAADRVVRLLGFAPTDERLLFNDRLATIYRWRTP